MYTDTAVSDFRVYISNEPSTGEKDLVFTAYTLTPGDAITISANFTVREIFIRYESGGETTENTINLSGNTVTIQ